jgi:REP element-mobilizing transposase RayT
MTTPHRKRTRLEGFDYTTPGCYFVTITTRNSGKWSGTVIDGQMVLNDAGKVVRDTWDSLPDRFPGIMLDSVVVMPDHVHGIVMLGTDPEEPSVHALTDVVGAFRSISAVAYGRGVREQGWRPYFGHFWHRSFRDTIIRNEHALDACRAYIDGNPGRWAEKNEH